MFEIKNKALPIDCFLRAKDSAVRILLHKHTQRHLLSAIKNNRTILKEEQSDD